MKKTEWWYDWPECDDGKFYITLRIDESSTYEEIEAEIEYWSEDIMLNEVKDPHKKAIMQAIKWMTTIAGEK